MDHGHPCGTESTSVSLYSTEITRYHSWFLEFKLGWTPFCMAMMDSLYLMWMWLPIYAKNSLLDCQCLLTVETPAAGVLRNFGPVRCISPYEVFIMYVSLTALRFMSYLLIIGQPIRQFPNTMPPNLTPFKDLAHVRKQYGTSPFTVSAEYTGNYNALCSLS